MQGDIPVPGDYFGDGVERLAVFRPSNGYWYIKGLGSSDWGATAGNLAIQCGMQGDIPVPGDYFNEGKMRMAVFRPSNGYWYIKGPEMADWGSSSGNLAIQCGMAGDVPVPADYFAEGKPRLAVWRPSNGNWYVKGEGFADWGASNGNTVTQCGVDGDIPMAMDFHDEGKPRMAVWRPSDGNWYIKGEGVADWGASNGNTVTQCGLNGDIPIAADYFDEGKPRLAVYRPSNGVWYIKGAGLENWGNTEGNHAMQCGMSGDIPINLPYYGW